MFHVKQYKPAAMLAFLIHEVLKPHKYNVSRETIQSQNVQKGNRV